MLAATGSDQTERFEPRPGRSGEPIGLGRVAWELLASALVAVVVSLAVQWATDRLHIPMPSYVPTALAVFCTVVLLVVLLVMAARRRWAAWGTPAIWVLVSAFGTIPLAMSLQGTKFYLFGLGGDQFFRTQYLDRLATSPALADGNYHGLPAYYPAAWFWLGGRFADLFGLPAWQAFKPWAILTLAVVPVLAFTLWSAVVRRPVALLLSLLTCVVGLAGAYEPYAYLIAGTIAPMAVLGWRYFRSVVRDPAMPLARPVGYLVILGLYLGACGATYSVLFGFFGFVLVGLAAVALVGVGLRGRAEGESVRWGRIVGRVVGRLVLIGLIALPVFLLVWAPYVITILRGGRTSGNVALRYLPQMAAELPSPMFDVTLSGALCLFGLGWLIVAVRRSHIAQALGVVVLACYGWYLLSFLALVAKTTLLAMKVQTTLTVTLFCAAGFGLVELVGWVRANAKLAARFPVRTMAVVLAVFGITYLVQTFPDAVDQSAGGTDLFAQAYNEYYDNGVNALGESDPTQDSYWNGKLIDTIGRMTGKQPQDLILLTSDTTLLDMRPYWSFQINIAPYANPLANYPDRMVQIETWSKAPDATTLLHDLDTSPFTPPTVFVLKRAPDGLHMTLAKDAFPLAASNAYQDAVFQPGAFADPRFHTEQVGPFTVVVRR